ncbi:molybdopterin-guanine dinucleotide biosynthesis protein B [Solemya pervernicosa gill symbiont]|uniref:Molybdopterin-guanine dinucleotide biosynthesis protein B n=2 Tax=Gammaproteobacteria incertae sedis TaxID=118884 RepID=A0A1T2L6G5_9GAMM|nr:molybdopterin-guanine dinucleotide biosynthesis protein MobB [Candidatus Reidiella endopervernicosa]OOZ40640.1 molybdopterin-guanine dinucleotide biosynthesis protein B [Solemya pervernicosa gill symbiont]QKQ27394.1 molybdopterin-guanine dinucleotide biosynthesis protein B [Candidatus Reidiella endopervernicosa]
MKRPPVLGFAAFSGTGKTTLLKKIIPQLNDRGVRIALIKHAHHNFDIDTPGKDSYELRKAGAGQVLISSDKRSALITEKPQTEEPRLEDMIVQLDHMQTDLILVEGFRHLPFTKIELHRPSREKPLLAREDSSIIAIASDSPIASAPDLPHLDLNNSAEIAEFIYAWYTNQSNRTEQ